MKDRPPCIARYEREIAGSLAEVWDNVHDWEHLPWLHCTTFRSIELLEQGDWGWRARVGLPPDADGAETVIELRRRPGEQAYDVTTLSGLGEGTVIATRLRERSSEQTAVSVGFHLPGVGDEAAPAIGNAYVALYTRLWDEDQQMIDGRRSAEACPPPIVPPGARSNLGLRESLSLPLDFTLSGRRFRLVEHQGELLAHDTTCPHRLGPLCAPLDPEGRIVCPWHGYRYDVRSGRSADGRNLRLARPPSVRIRAEDGSVEAVMEPAE